MKQPSAFLAKTLTGASVSHGFFGRKGGVSTGVYASLNAGRGSADHAKDVGDNRARIACVMGVKNECLVGVYQVHSAKAVHVDQPWPTDIPQADALVSATPGLALSILTADCAPVLLADGVAGVVGAAHAGWRGALDGILSSTVEAMTDLGAKRENINAAIGPCIAQTSYEVGPEFLDTFTSVSPSHAGFFERGDADRWQFNLKAFCQKALHDAGVKTVEVLREDTCAQEQDFFSYRRATKRGESDYGRNISVISLHNT